MSIPVRPVFQKEGPASACVLRGRNLSWFNCSTLSTAMGIDKSTLGRIRISGCQVRDETGDYAGGTTIPQMVTVCTSHGVSTEQHVGANVASPWYAAYQLALGRGFVLQGNTHPDGRGNVNHAVWVNEPVGGEPGTPTGALVYDPWSNGPVVWPWSKVKTFAAALHPWGESDPRTLGPGKFYCLIFPKTRPPLVSLWGDDVPDAVQAVDPSGQRTATLFTKAHAGYGTVINMPDLVAMFTHYKLGYGSVIDPSDLRALFKKAGV